MAHLFPFELGMVYSLAYVPKFSLESNFIFYCIYILNFYDYYYQKLFLRQISLLSFITPTQFIFINF